MREHVGIARRFREIAIDMNRIVIARTCAVQGEGVSCNRRICSLEESFTWTRHSIVPSAFLKSREHMLVIDNLPPCGMQRGAFPVSGYAALQRP
jgi:hypothetical protein